MAEREVVGFCRCPVCGAENQEVRVNVNQKLYGYCDNGCAFKFNSAQSRRLLPALRAGRTMNENDILIFSNNKELKENVEEKNTNTARQFCGRLAGSSAGRRDDGQPAAAAAEQSGNTGKPAGRGWLAGIFGDDDGDDE